MELHGSLIDNLQAAVASARRLRGQRVYPETVNHWRELLVLARDGSGTVSGEDRARLTSLADQLEQELGSRP